MNSIFTPPRFSLIYGLENTACNGMEKLNSQQEKGGLQGRPRPQIQTI